MAKKLSASSRHSCRRADSLVGLSFSMPPSDRSIARQDPTHSINTESAFGPAFFSRHEFATGHCGAVLRLEAQMMLIKAFPPLLSLAGSW
jgi:hypothetical protein